ncbi:MMPL family transporter [Gammaproteobacteria bacterium]|nr:MMPL family transporter [Gammaproteobacteria bacterium]
MSKIISKYITHHPKSILLIFFTILLFSILNLNKFKLDASSDSLVLESDDDLKYYREVNADYSSSDFLIIIFDPKKDLFSQEAITQVREMVDAFAAIEGVESVLSYLDAPLLFSPKMGISELADNLRTIEDQDTDRDLARLEFKNSPLYTELLTDKEANYTAMQLILSSDDVYEEAINKRYSILETINSNKYNPSNHDGMLEQINDEIKQLNAESSIARDTLIKTTRTAMKGYEGYGQLYLGGTAMIASDMISFIESDLKYFAIGVLIMFIITLSIIFKKLRWVTMPLVSSALIALVVIGFLGWMDWRVTVVSSNFISLLLIISISLTIHLIVRYQELYELDPSMDKTDLVTLTIEQMLKPCFYTALTTIIAFASLSVSEIKPVIDFGKMMVAGIFFAFIFSFTLVPVAMLLFTSDKGKESKDFSKGITLVFSSFTQRYGNIVMLISVILFSFSLYGISKLTVENRFIDYFKPTTEIYKGMELLDTKLGGTAPLDIVINAPENWKISDEEDFDNDFEFDDDFGSDEDVAENGYWWNTISLDRLEEIHDYIDSLPEIGKVLSVASGIKVARELKDGEALSELDLALVKTMLPDDIKDNLLSSYISEDENQVRISARVIESAEGLNRNQLLSEISNTLESEFQLESDQFRLTGLAVLYNNMLQSLFDSQIGTIVIVFSIIFIMFLILFRSLYLSIIGIIPNLLAASVVLGSMGLFSVPLDIMTITVAAISVGMAVDNTIHYIHRFKKEFSRSNNYQISMQNSHKTIGRAMFYTSLTIILGFLVFATSNFNPSVYFGFFVSLAMVMALLGALTLLPQLILTFKPLGKEKL